MSEPLFNTSQLAARAAAIAANAPAPSPEPFDASTVVTPSTASPAASASETAENKKGRQKLKAVPEPQPLSEAEEHLVKWRRLELEARAKALGVSPEALKPLVYEENWRERLPSATKPAADPAYAGLYELTGGAVCMPGGLIAEPGTIVRLSAEDGKHITERGIGKMVAV
jgi:hypothetical protein